jgi:mono/diheme cytochrome c family protein
MQEHFTKVREVEEAIIRGDVEAAQAPARWLADHQATIGFPPQTAQPLKDMQAAARSVAATEDLNNAAQAAAHLVGTCGSCHSAAKVEPKMPPPPDRTRTGERGQHMVEHQVAVDLLYRGLIVPVSQDWKKGAEALKAAPLRDKTMKDIEQEALAAEARIHELADRALAAPDKSTRVAIYGEVIGSCASCHGLHGRVWGPGLPKT